MKILSKIYQRLNYIPISLLIIFVISKTVFANDNLFVIQGNNFTDSDVIVSLLENIPENLDEEYSNEIIKILNDSNLFSDVKVKFIDNKYNIIVNEYPNIRKIYFEIKCSEETEKKIAIRNMTPSYLLFIISNFPI